MNIEIKKSEKPVKYESAIQFMENRLVDLSKEKTNELIWTLEHNEIYTAGTSFDENEILDVLKQAKLHYSSRTIILKLVDDFIFRLILES